MQDVKKGRHINTNIYMYIDVYIFRIILPPGKILNAFFSSLGLVSALLSLAHLSPYTKKMENVLQIY